MNFIPVTPWLERDLIKSFVDVILCEDTKGIWAVKDGEPVAVCIMDNWTHTSVQVHLGIKNPFAIRHGFFEEIAKYVFITADKKSMIGLVPSNNKKALKLDKHIGFNEVFRIKDGFADGVDYIVMQLTKNNCRFIDLREAA